MDGHVIVLDRATGRRLWATSFGSPIESSPIVQDGIDYFGAWNGRLYAFDLRTHRLRWTRSLGAKITSSAAIAGGRLFIGDYGGRLWALSPRTRSDALGPLGERADLRHARRADGRVFVPSSTGGSLTAFSTTRPLPLARQHRLVRLLVARRVRRARVLRLVQRRLLRRLRRERPHAWTVGTGGPISGAAVVVDGVAYAGSFAHRIVGVDARSGRVLLRFGHGHYVPVSGNGKFLLFHGYSRLYAVEPKRAVTTKTATHHKRHLRHERK